MKRMCMTILGQAKLGHLERVRNSIPDELDEVGQDSRYSMLPDITSNLIRCGTWIQLLNTYTKERFRNIERHALDNVRIQNNL